jgi:hypothetical protein
MPTRSEFERAFHDLAEGRDPDEEVDVGGEPLPAIRVVRELLTSTSIMPNHRCVHSTSHEDQLTPRAPRSSWRGGARTGLSPMGPRAMADRRRKPSTRLERIRIEKLERIRVDKLERIVPEFKRMTINEVDANALPGDTDADVTPASSRAGDS